MSEQKKGKSGRGCLIAITAFFGLTIFYLILSVFMAGSDQAPELAVAEGSRFIPGIAPVDIYLNLEKIGFATEHIFNADYGYSWISTMRRDGIVYEVSVFSEDADVVQTVRASATVESIYKDITVTQQFFKMIASLPFDSKDPIASSDWINKKFDKDEATLQIGDVELRMVTASKVSKLMTLEAIK